MLQYKNIFYFYLEGKSLEGLWHATTIPLKPRISGYSLKNLYLMLLFPINLRWGGIKPRGGAKWRPAAGLQLPQCSGREELQFPSCLARRWAWPERFSINSPGRAARAPLGCRHLEAFTGRRLHPPPSASIRRPPPAGTERGAAEPP